MRRIGKEKIGKITKEDAVKGTIFMEEEKKEVEFLYGSSVLHLRGNLGQPTLQPLISNKTSNILLYNGEIFDSTLDFDF